MNGKMPIYRCSCGVDLLIVPNISKMVLAIRAHLIEHEMITGKRLSEACLTKEIISCLSDQQVDECINNWNNWIEQDHNKVQETRMRVESG